MTYIPPQTVRVNLEEMSHRVVETINTHLEVITKFHEVWYRAPHTWGYTSFLGVSMMKNPLDLWILQDIIARTKPQQIIETGTFHGGSALWMAWLQDVLQIPGARLITIDIEDYWDSRITNPRIYRILGDSVSPLTLSQIPSRHPYPTTMVVLDSAHTYEHVREELERYAPLVSVGQYLVVEDTNITMGEGEGGPAQAVREFLEAHPGEFEIDLLCERYLLTMNPKGWLKRVRTA
jgi:cephalosporin hydroxylase